MEGYERKEGMDNDREEIYKIVAILRFKCNKKNL